MACGTPVLAMPGALCRRSFRTEFRDTFAVLSRSSQREFITFISTLVTFGNTFNFSLDRMVANYASVYKDALAQRRI
jgi:hypothetical protein